MWAIGLLAGAALGAAVDARMLAPGALLGALVGALAGRRLAEARRQADARFADLDAKTRYLYERLVALEARLAGSDVAPAGPPPAMPDDAAAIAAVSPVPEVSVPAVPAATAATATEPGAGAPPADDREARQPAPPLRPSLHWQRLLGGNVLAKVGVVLLFFGAASALRLAAEYGLLPVPLRLAAVAAAALGMIAFGWRQRTIRAAFALALQGGGYALLYLVVHFMLSRYGMLDPATAFAAFAGLGAACVAQATAQDGRALAVLGLSGAFLAPVLAGGPGTDHVMLFGYLALLDVGVFALACWRSWRGVALAGLLLSLGVTANWGLERYTPAHFATTEPFLLGYFALYSALPLVLALRGAPAGRGYVDGILILGTPVLTGFLQVPLLTPHAYGLALWAAPAGLYYLALGRLLQARRDPRLELLAQAQFWVGASLLTLAVPFAFGASASVAVWALEGAGAVWLGSRQGRAPARLAGYALQLAAAAHLLLHADELAHALPVLNERGLAMLLVAAAALVSAALARRQAGGEARLAALLLAWGLGWWFGAAFAEFDDFLHPSLHPAAGIALTAATLAVAEWAGRRLAWTAPRWAAALLAAPLPLFAAWQWDEGRHPAGDGGWLAWPLALAAHGWTLLRHHRDALVRAMAARHAVALWLVAGLVGLELAWQARELAPRVGLLEGLAWGLGPALALATGMAIARRPALRPSRSAYLGIGAAPLLLWLVAWTLDLNARESGRAGAWTYIPFANPLDFVQAAVLAVLLAWADAQRAGARDAARLGVALLALAWLSAMAARLLHHWTGIAFHWPQLIDSIALQAAWSLLWSGVALGLMLQATRRGLRTRWFAGFGLLALVGLKLLLVDTAHVDTVGRTVSLVGVALLVIAAGYFSPTPPKPAPGGPPAH